MAAGVVLEGVLYPIPAPGEPLVSGHFYATVLGPIAIAAVAASAWALDPRRSVRSLGRMLTGAIGAAVIAMAVGGRTPFAVAAAAAFGAVAIALAAGLTSREVSWPNRLGHLGFGVLLLGIAGSTQADRVTISLTEGSAVEFAGVRFEHRSVGVEPGPTSGSDAVVATLLITDGDRRVTLRPSLVAFADRGAVLAESALDSRPRRDVQVVLRSGDDAGAARYDISVTPLVQAVWWGALLIAAAGVGAATDQLRSRRRASRARSSNSETVAERSDSDASRSA